MGKLSSSVPVLVPSGCCDGTLQTGQLINDRHTPHGAGDWKSKVKVPADSCFTDGRLAVSSHSRRARGPCGVSYKGTRPVHEAPPMPSPPPRGPPQHHHTGD